MQAGAAGCDHKAAFAHTAVHYVRLRNGEPAQQSECPRLLSTKENGLSRSGARERCSIRFRLERRPQTELELTVCAVGLTLRLTESEVTRPVGQIRIVSRRMVEEVERLSTEGECRVVVAWNQNPALVESRVVALEASASNDTASATSHQLTGIWEQGADQYVR